MAQRPTKQGYATRKALDILAYERGYGKKPTETPKRFRGPVYRELYRYRQGKKPRSETGKRIYTAKVKYAGRYDNRPFIKFGEGYFSGRKGQDILDVAVKVAYDSSYDHTRQYNAIWSEEEFEDNNERLAAIVEKADRGKSVSWWNKRLKPLGMKAYYETYIA